jgi:hypothetical protein
MREAIETGAFRGLDQQAADEFTRRRYTITSKSGERIKLDCEPKPPFRQRTGKSPDLADARCIALDCVAAAGVVLRSIRSDYDIEPSNDPSAWGKAESARVNAYQRTLGRADLDVTACQTRIAEADHQLDRLVHPPKVRVTSSTAPVQEVRWALTTDAPADADDLEDCDRAHRAEVVRGMQRRLNEVLR